MSTVISKSKGYRNVPSGNKMALPAMTDDKCNKINFTNGVSKSDACNRTIEEGFNQSKNIEEALGVILGTYLKADTNLLDSLSNLKLVWKCGEHMVRIYKQTCSYKNTDGVPVSSKNKSARYLLDHCDISSLFLRSSGYIASIQSKRWKPADKLVKYMKVSVHKLCDILDYIACNSMLLDVPTHMFPKMLSSSYNIYNNIILNINTIRHFEVDSIFNLLLNTVKITKDGLHVAILHEAATQEDWGRTYNVFCRLRSYERLQLGYFCYDMSAALQVISLKLIGATEKDYPLLWQYSHDTEYKNYVRTTIAKDLGIDKKKVKETLTAFANGKVVKENDHKLYKAFYTESDKLRREVLKHVRLNEPDVLKRAIEQYRKELPEELDWQDTISKETHKLMRSKASIFFFVWTWYERIIRKAMLTVLTDGIEVHDAVYSKMDIESHIIEKAIADLTAFNVKIGKETPNNAV